MDVRSIECKIGASLNMGDFKSLRVDFGMVADLDRNEDVDAASAQLRMRVMANLVAMGSDAHPDRMRGLVEGNQQAPLPAPAATEKAKPGRKPKEAAAAVGNGNAAATARTSSVTTASPSEPTLEDELNDSIPANGGGSSDGLLDDGDDLLSESEPEITKEVLTAKCRELITKDKSNAGLAKLFKTVGATSLKDTPTDKYQTLYTKVVAALAS